MVSIRRIQIINHHGFCQAFLFLSYTFRIISVWLIIVFTFERYVAICWPLQRRLICTQNFSKRMVSGVSLLAAVLCIYKPIISGVHIIQGEMDCSKLLEYEKLSFILDSIYGVLITGLPFVIITLLNVLILRKLVCRHGQELTIRSVSNETKMRFEFTFILLSISTCFVCLNIPYFIMWCERFTTVNKTNKMLGLEAMINSVTTRPQVDGLLLTRTIFFINYSSNFFLYCLTGKQYRKYTKELLCCGRKQKTSQNSGGYQLMGSHASQTYEYRSNLERSAVSTALWLRSLWRSVSITQDLQELNNYPFFVIFFIKNSCGYQLAGSHASQTYVSGPIWKHLQFLQLCDADQYQSPKIETIL